MALEEDTMTPNISLSFHFNTSEGLTHQTISAVTLTSAVLLLVTFVFGLVMNTLYLWVLTFRTRRSVNSTWFFHLILGNLLFTLSIPFFTAYVIMKPRWIFGLYMCKIINSIISLDMYVTVFVLIVISIDRYCLVFHPIWYRRYMNPQIATGICLLLWFLALLLTSPYFLFRKVKYENNITICENDYTLSGRWNRQRVKWIMFTTRLFLGLIIPLAVITTCYLKIIIKISKDNMARSNKPYRVICIAIISFFVSWTPYHVWYGMSADQDRFPEENFKTKFRRSLLDFIELVFNETISSANRSIDEKREQQSLSKEEKT